MHPVLDQEELSRVINLARRYLEPHQPADYRLEVVPEAVRQEEDWFYVVVEPTRDDIRSYDLSSRLADAEIDLQEKESIKILLVPVLPG